MAELPKYNWVTDKDSREVTIRDPRLYVAETCLADCRKAKKLCQEAALLAVTNADTQFDVVCQGRRVLCRGRIEETGAFEDGVYEPALDKTDPLGLPLYDYSVLEAIQSGAEPTHLSEIDSN